MCFKRGPDACRIYLKKAGPFGLGEVPQEAQTRTDALNEIDQQCFDRLNVTRTSVSKAFIVIDHTKFCGNTFHDEYRTGRFGYKKEVGKQESKERAIESTNES